MTQMPPPPPNVQYAPMYQQPPSSTNAWSIVSLICGILGCFVITPIVAIITGIIGLATSKPPRGGKGMAVTGIILGLLWIGVAGIAVAGFSYVVTHVSVLAPIAEKQKTMQYLNALAAGDQAGAETIAGGLTDSQRAALLSEVKQLGTCRDVQVSNSQTENVNGVLQISFTGTAVFEHGSRPIDVAASIRGPGITLERFELK